MILTPIPNQPINFGDLSCCKHDDRRVPLLMEMSDTIRIQMGLSADHVTAYNPQLISDDQLTGGGWSGHGLWSVSDGSKCAGLGNVASYQELGTWIPTVGVTYLVRVTLDTIVGSVVFSMGGIDHAITAPGASVFTVTVGSAAPPRITVGSNETQVCARSVEAWVVMGGGGAEPSECNVTVELRDAVTDAMIYTFDSDTEPQFFRAVGSNILIDFALVNAAEALADSPCVYVYVNDACSGEEGLRSQPIQVSPSCGKTTVVRSCLSADAMGFVAPAVFEVRLEASLSNTRWDYEAEEERWSNGYINRYYADRTARRRLMIKPVDGTLLPYLAALPLFDHVYIDGEPYVVDADAIEPDYVDEWTCTAGLSIGLRPQWEGVSKVLCAAPGPGCDPANDPICPAVNATFTQPYYNDTPTPGHYVGMSLYSSLGFVPESVQVFRNGDLFTGFLYTGPVDQQFGPFALGDTIRIVIHNATLPECDHEEVFEITQCAGEQTVSFTMGSAPGAGYHDIVSTAGHVTVFSHFDGLITTFNTYSIPAGTFVNGRSYCLWSSDIDGAPSGVIDRFRLRNVASIDLAGLVSLHNLLLGGDVAEVATPPSGAMTSITLETPSIMSFTPPLTVSPLGILSFIGCVNLTDVTVPLGLSLYRVYAPGASLSAATVDALCNALDPSSPSIAIPIDFSGGSNAAPTAASLAARNAWIAAGGTFLFNP